MNTIYIKLKEIFTIKRILAPIIVGIIFYILVYRNSTSFFNIFESSFGKSFSLSINENKIYLMKWFMQKSILVYMIIKIISNDGENYYIYELIRFKNIKRWLREKVLLISSYTVLYYILIFTTILALSIIGGKEIVGVDRAITILINLVFIQITIGIFVLFISLILDDRCAFAVVMAVDIPYALTGKSVIYNFLYGEKNVSEIGVLIVICSIVYILGESYISRRKTIIK